MVQLFTDGQRGREQPGGLKNNDLTVHLQGRQFWYIIWTLSGIITSYTFTKLAIPYKASKHIQMALINIHHTLQFNTHKTTDIMV